MSITHVTQPIPGTPQADFPGPIRDSLSRLAGRVGLCAEIEPRSRLLLAEILRCVSYRTPTEPVRIRNITFAAALSASERSVGRLKANLERSGWIHRRQVKSRIRGMQISDIRLTEKALDALGLAAPGAARALVDKREPSYQQQQPKRRPPAASALLIPQYSSNRQPSGVFESQELKPGEHKPLSAPELEILAELQAEFGDDLEGMDAAEAGELQAEQAPVTPPGVPADLVLLSNAGLSLPAIRKLMGMATRAGARLGDVITVAGQHIARARNTYSYVLKLLGSKKDWSTLARGELAMAQVTQGSAEIDQAGRRDRQAAEAAARIAVSAIGDAVIRRPGGPVAWRQVAGQLFELDLRAGGTWAVQGSARAAREISEAWKRQELEVLEAGDRGLVGVGGF